MKTKKKRVLIEFTQENIIECDNKSCDYIIKNPNPELESELTAYLYLNKPCPKCGENLFTEEDFISYIKLNKVIKWINRWFSWITIFYCKSEQIEVTAHIHKGVNFYNEKGDKL